MAGLSLRTWRSHVLEAVKPLLFSFPSLVGATSQRHPPEIAGEVGKRAQHAMVVLCSNATQEPENWKVRKEFANKSCKQRAAWTRDTHEATGSLVLVSVCLPTASLGRVDLVEGVFQDRLWENNSHGHGPPEPSLPMGRGR